MKFIQSTVNKGLWKKVGIISGIAIVVIILLVILIINLNNPSSPLLNLSSNSTFVDKTNTISITLPKKYNLNTENISANHILELSSGDNLFIAVSVEGAYLGNSTIDAIKRDKDSFLQNYSNTSNVSDVKEETVNGLKTYTYSFNYRNELKDYTLETIWVEGDRGLFIIDLSYLTEKAELYTELHSDILNKLVFINE